MIKYIFPGLIAGVLFHVTAFGQKKHELLVCGGSKVVIVNAHDLSDTIPEIIWSWDATKAPDLPEAYSKTYFEKVDECKPINKGKQILITSSSGGVALINRKDKKVLFYAFVPNAHSAEMLPNGYIAVAGSIRPGGNCVELYHKSNSEKPVFRDSLYSGHGVLWDKKRKMLYALGYDVLRSYSLKDWNSNYPKLLVEKNIKLPGDGGHDLQRVPGGRQLILTDPENVWLYNIEAYTFSRYEPLSSPRYKDIKSTSFNPRTGEISFTKAQISWWSHNVMFLKSGNYLSFPDINVYKARWVSSP